MESPRPTRAGLLILLYAAQVAASVALSPTVLGGLFGFGTVISGLWPVISCFVQRDFSWKTFAVTKSCVLALNLGFLGLEELAKYLSFEGVSEMSNSVSAATAENLLDKITEKLSTLTLDQAMDMCWDGTRSLTALFGGLIDHAIRLEEGEKLRERVEKIVNKVAEREPMKSNLAGFYALMRLESEGEYMPRTIALQFRCWLDSAEFKRNKKFQEVLHTVMLSAGKESWSQGEYTTSVAVLLLHVVNQVNQHLKLKERVRKICTLVEEELGKMQGLSRVLTQHCRLTENQVSSLNIKKDVSCFSSEAYLPESADGLMLIAEDDLTFAKEKLRSLKGFLQLFSDGDKITLTHQLSEYIAVEVIGAALSSVVKSGATKGRDIKISSSSSVAAEDEIKNQAVELKIPNVLSGTGGKEPSAKAESLQYASSFTYELISLCESHNDDGVFPNPTQIYTTAASKLAKILLYCHSLQKPIVLIVELWASSTSEPTPFASSAQASSVVRVQLNPTRSEVLHAWLEESAETISLLETIDRVPDREYIRNISVFERLTWVMQMVLALPSKLVQAKWNGAVIAETSDIEIFNVDGHFYVSSVILSLQKFSRFPRSSGNFPFSSAFNAYLAITLASV